jgi:hypothetical protein
MRHTIWWIVLVSLVLLSAMEVDRCVRGSEASSGRITVSKETTYVTEPLRADGSVDYAAALNRRCSEGVTTKNNSAVLFWQAFGPSEILKDRRDKFFAMLGIPVPPETGNYLVPEDAFVDRLKNAGRPEAQVRGEGQELVFAQQSREAMKRPWSKAEFPALAEWLALNEEPLALLIEATKRPRRYDPINLGTNESLIDTPLRAAQKSREVVRALTIRAMLRLGQGKVDEAWQDLLACHRLSRLVGQGTFIVEALVGFAIDGIARGGDRALLEHAQLTIAQIARMRADLDHLPPMSKMVDKIDIGERFMYLDMLSMVAREGLSSGVSSITGLSGGSVGRGSESTVESMINSIGRMTLNWDVICCMGNSWYDREVEACRKPTRAERKVALDAFNKDLHGIATRAGSWKRLVSAMLLCRCGAISEQVGEVFVSLLLPATDAAIYAEDRWTMESELNKLAFALAAYRADHGAYPVKLADLTPKYLSAVPKDIFNAAELHYRQEGKGHLLYSVGRNGNDDGGKTLDDRKGNEDWDDLTVRMPAKGP